MVQKNTQDPSGDYHDGAAEKNREVEVAGYEQEQGKTNEPYEDADARVRYAKRDPAKRDAPVLIGWRIALFLFTSTIVQNLSSNTYSLFQTGYNNWTTEQQSGYLSTSASMLLLGPVFGFFMDMFRVRGERYRVSIIAGCVVNIIISFVTYAKYPAVGDNFYSGVIMYWLQQVSVMFIYIPMNVVVIRYANRCFYNSLSYEYDRLNEQLGHKGTEKTADERQQIRNVESTARVGNIMAQTMLCRSMGSFVYSIFHIHTTGTTSVKTPITLRWWVCMGAIGSCVLILQILFLMKRKYFADYNANDSKKSLCAQFVRDVIKVKRASLGRTHKPIGSNYLFIILFIFFFYSIPDGMTNCRYSFHMTKADSTKKHWMRAYTILASLGTVLGPFCYALWMTLAYMFENRRHRRRLQGMLNTVQRLKRNNEDDENSASDDDIDHEDGLRLVDKPYFYSPWQAGTTVITFAGCASWAFGIFFHLIGVMGRYNPNFNYNVFILFDVVVTNACYYFTIVSSIALVVIHCPFNYEASAFTLYSAAFAGTGSVTYPLTSSLASSLGVGSIGWYSSVGKGYWKLLLISIFFRFIPMLFVPGLPKCRADVRMNVENMEGWGVNEENQSRPAIVCTRDVILEEREKPREV
ncbi:hypothetical protein STCU_03363 [Strigomonas culicis]|uniref:Uncharacterized protein n=1 Tax=Strigomonas culicis TaxID=28005 RepID=S9ULB7_9TRYP|nr:hypothetical protein STCU_03363 [Strigomonas culicis]|eukprot:EPY31622.1 hypothetical protein STCU_03363 [Strigomonas culicis]